MIYYRDERAEDEQTVRKWLEKAIFRWWWSKKDVIAAYTDTEKRWSSVVRLRSTVDLQVTLRMIGKLDE